MERTTNNTMTRVTPPAIPAVSTKIFSREANGEWIRKINYLFMLITKVMKAYANMIHRGLWIHIVGPYNHQNIYNDNKRWMNMIWTLKLNFRRLSLLAIIKNRFANSNRKTCRSIQTIPFGIGFRTYIGLERNVWSSCRRRWSRFWRRSRRTRF